MPITTKTAAYANEGGAPLRKAVTPFTVGASSNVVVPIECYKATSVTVTVTITPSTVAGDLAVTAFQPNAGLTAPSATPITPTTSTGPTFAGGTTTFTATYPVTGLKKIFLQCNNASLSSATITVTQSNDISSSINAP